LEVIAGKFFKMPQLRRQKIQAAAVVTTVPSLLVPNRKLHTV
jgi:hypothetical protein